MKEYATALLQLAAQANEFKPAVDAVKKMLQMYGPEVAELLDGFTDYVIDRKAASVKRLMENHGFTKDEAIILALDSSVALEKFARQVKAGKKE